MKKLKSYTLLGVLALSLVGSAVSAEIQTDVIDEKWGKPTLVYGSGLNDQQVGLINTAFGIKQIENVNRQVNSGTDFETYLGQTGVSDSNLFSSVLVQKRDSGKGVIVKIKTPENITSITETQYANAAITAGATDVEIEVASPIKVTGESALVGVYKALTANGQEVDSARANVASAELSTVNEISSSQEGNKDFDSAALDLAMAQIKTSLAEYKSFTNGLADNAKLEELVNTALKDNGLDGIITPEQVQSLVSFANAYQNTSAIDSQEVANQLKSYAETTYNSLSEKFKQFQESGAGKGMLESIGMFFENLWKGLTSLFG